MNPPTRFKRVLPLLLVGSFCVCFSLACKESKQQGLTAADGATPPDDGGWTIDDDGNVVIEGDGVEVTDDTGTFTCHVVLCGNRITTCGDCSDNDEDGLIDANDPECLGPCDNYEGEELFGGIGGEFAEQCKADCYFDFGNGAGNDQCKWSRSCDPLTPKLQCDYDEDLLGSKDCPDVQNNRCEDTCMPLTPNGCDCFGCCTHPLLAGQGEGGSDAYVFIGSEEGCTLDDINNPEKCRSCTPAPSCLNTCQECELCLGKDTLPEACTGEPPPDEPPPGPRCPVDVQACGLPGDDPCPTNSFCITGCCYSASGS